MKLGNESRTKLMKHHYFQVLLLMRWTLCYHPGILISVGFQPAASQELRHHHDSCLSRLPHVELFKMIQSSIESSSSFLPF
jgi:hypothetical protein